jgi:D-sedoheptulose 7-phosphate isomerase
MVNSFKTAFSQSVELKNQILLDKGYEVLEKMGKEIVDSIKEGGKLLICGNGGSAADAQHLAAELLIRLKPKNNRTGIPAIALTMDSSTMSACGNDFGYEVLFSRIVDTLGNSGDILLGITTSGNSQNVNEAFKKAKDKGISSFGFLGSGGGTSLSLCDMSFVVPSNDTARVQEAHITAGHALMEYIEERLISCNHIELDQK